MKKIGLILFFLTLIMMTGFAQEDAIILDNGNITIEISEIVIYDHILNQQPEEMGFVSLLFDVTNDSDQRICVGARDFRLVIDDIEYSPDTATLRVLQPELEPERESMGGIRGLCLNGGDSALSFLIFDAPELSDAFTIRFENTVAEISKVEIVSTAEPFNQLSIRRTPSVNLSRHTPTPMMTPSLPAQLDIERSEEFDEMVIRGGMLFGEIDVDITSIEVIDARPEGYRSVVVNYNMGSSDADENTFEILALLSMLGGAIRGGDVDVDTIILMPTNPQGVMGGIISVLKTDIFAFLDEEITIIELTERIEIITLGSDD